MKVTFIRPNLFDCRSMGSMEVLAFAILKSLTPPDVETVLHDERLAPVPYDDPTDLVALTVETFTARRAYQIAHQFRRRGVKVVMGGFHPTFLPEEAAHFADAVVVGDAENTWPKVIADARAGRLKRFYRESEFPSMEGMAPDHGIFKNTRYVPLTLVQSSRGCKFNCSFCSIRAFYGSSMRQRPAREIVEEIERLGAKRVLFVDDNIFINSEQAKELFRALIPLRITWHCQVSIEVARDPEVLDLMARSGCTGALIGFESLNPATLKEMNKGWNLKWADYGTSVRKLQDAGVMIYAAFVFGYDSDTPDAFDRTVEFAIESKFILAGFNIFMPMPATPMYERLKLESRLICDKWWIDPRYRYGEATFHPRNMTADQLTDGCYRARTEFSKYSSILRRLLVPRTNLKTPYRIWLYLMSNHILRREVHAKQGMPLGAASEEDPFVVISGDARGPGHEVEHPVAPQKQSSLS